MESLALKEAEARYRASQAESSELSELSEIKRRQRCCVDLLVSERLCRQTYESHDSIERVALSQWLYERQQLSRARDEEAQLLQQSCSSFWDEDGTGARRVSALDVLFRSAVSCGCLDSDSALSAALFFGCGVDQQQHAVDVGARNRTQRSTEKTSSVERRVSPSAEVVRRRKKISQLASEVRTLQLQRLEQEETKHRALIGASWQAPLPSVLEERDLIGELLLARSARQIENSNNHVEGNAATPPRHRHHWMPFSSPSPTSKVVGDVSGVKAVRALISALVAELCLLDPDEKRAFKERSISVSSDVSSLAPRSQTKELARRVESALHCRRKLDDLPSRGIRCASKLSALSPLVRAVLGPKGADDTDITVLLPAKSSQEVLYTKLGPLTVPAAHAAVDLALCKGTVRGDMIRAELCSDFTQQGPTAFARAHQAHSARVFKSSVESLHQAIERGRRLGVAMATVQRFGWYHLAVLAVRNVAARRIQQPLRNKRRQLRMRQQTKVAVRSRAGAAQRLRGRYFLAWSTTFLSRCRTRVLLRAVAVHRLEGSLYRLLECCELSRVNECVLRRRFVRRWVVAAKQRVLHRKLATLQAFNQRCLARRCFLQWLRHCALPIVVVQTRRKRRKCPIAAAFYFWVRHVATKHRVRVWSQFVRLAIARARRSVSNLQVGAAVYETRQASRTQQFVSVWNVMTAVSSDENLRFFQHAFLLWMNWARTRYEERIHSELNALLTKK